MRYLFGGGEDVFGVGVDGVDGVVMVFDFFDGREIVYVLDFDDVCSVGV